MYTCILAHINFLKSLNRLIGIYDMLREEEEQELHTRSTRLFCWSRDSKEFSCSRHYIDCEVSQNHGRCCSYPLHPDLHC